MMTASSLMRIAALVALVIAQVEAADARGRGGGGLRGGGASSMSRGGGGGEFNRSTGSINRSSGSVNRGSSSVNRSGGTYNRPGGGSYNRPSDRSPAGQAGSRVQGAPDRSASQRPSTTDRAGVAQGSRENRQASDANREANINNSVNVDIDNGWGGWGGHYDYPIAAGIAIGAIAGLTAAAFGSAYYALPRGCSHHPYAGYSYYSCGGAWYQPQYEGDTVVYVTVPQPSATQQPSNTATPAAPVTTTPK